MNLKHLIEVIAKKNPLDTIRKTKMRNNLKNKDITLLCPNCLGGILFHDLGLQFKSPTVNLMMLQTDFIKFCLHLDDFLKGQLIFFKHDEYECPCAHLFVENNDYIDVHFTHYKNKEDALKKWNDRCERINKENIFIVLQERDGLTYEMMKELGKLNVKGLLIFTAHDYRDLPYCLYLKEFNSDGVVGNILKKSYINGSRKYEKYFDFVKWFNESNGTLDISKYKK